MGISLASLLGAAEVLWPNAVRKIAGPGIRRIPRPGFATFCLCLIVSGAVTFSAMPLPAAEGPGRKTPTTFERLKVGGTVFTNVTVTDVTATHLFIKSPQGFANLRLNDLEPDVKSLFVREDRIAPVTPDTPKRSSDAAVPAAAREPSTDVRSGVMAKLPQSLTKTISSGVGAILAMTGCCMVVGGWLWLVVVAFRAHVGWGLAVLIGSVTCGLINFIFMVSHWEESKRPFWVYLGGILVIVINVFLPRPH